MTPLAAAPDPALTALARTALALLFASAAGHKLRDLRSFAATVHDYRLLPAPLAAPAAGGLVAAEGCTALALLVPAAGGAGSLAALALLATYSLAIAVNLARGRRHLDCGCLGAGRRQPIGAWMLARNALVAAAPLALLVAARTGGDAARALGWVDAVSVAGGVAALALVWTAAHALLALPVRRRAGAS